MTETEKHQASLAAQWMGALPRDQFDFLLILTKAAHERGRRERDSEVRALRAFLIELRPFIPEIPHSADLVEKADAMICPPEGGAK